MTKVEIVDVAMAYDGNFHNENVSVCDEECTVYPFNGSTGN